MQKKLFSAAIIFPFIMMIAACGGDDNGGGNTPGGTPEGGNGFDGTWVGDTGLVSLSGMVWIISGNTYTQQTKYSDPEYWFNVYQGSFSYTDTQLTFVVERIWGEDIPGETRPGLTAGWYTKEEAGSGLEHHFQTFNYDYTINGNTMSVISGGGQGGTLVRQ